MNIYEISNDLKNIYNTLEENGGELSEELEQALSITEGMLEDKAESYCKFISELKFESEAYKAEIDRLTKRKKALDNLCDRVRQNLLNGLNLAQIEKMKCGLFSLSVRKTQSVNVTDENSVPDEYCEITRKISKTAVKEAINSGIDVNGCEIIENKSLIIR